LRNAFDFAIFGKAPGPSPAIPAKKQGEEAAGGRAADGLPPSTPRRAARGMVIAGRFRIGWRTLIPIGSYVPK